MIFKAGLGFAAATVLGAVSPASSAPAFPSSANAPRDYQVIWSARQLEDLRKKLKSFQFPKLIPGTGWDYGMDPDYLRSLIGHWADRFDMEGAARNLNRFPQYITKVEDLDIHFIRVIGEGGPDKARLPLICTHGWPGSTSEFWDAIEPLAFPSLFGAGSEVAFDLIIPSLPGHGPSGKPIRPVGARTTARLWDKLMRENLGYETFYAQGGDWGAGVTGWLALVFPEAVKAIHLNLMIVAPQVSPKTDAEHTFYAKAEEDEQLWGAYYQLQATEPQSLAYAFIDNPVAQAAWLIQRFYEWSDKRTRPFKQVFTMDQLLTNVMIYVMNDAFQSSTWFYTGSHEENVKQMPKDKHVTVPTGFASYGGDSRSPTPPRSIIEQGYNLQHWYDVPQGGHFAAMEVPGLYVQGIRDWARVLRL
ncbi:epoxide hydrolase [Skermanella aerolata]|uniref:Epoxide hydrolase n=1 Tax=Skermanella aerolata TaxID=393310 RepID=A0A512E1P3_9PROT|nr:epoxide hydrolase family protein [Skermanella aerolata]KJB91200.1 epoxide hydrolase [Skermanella aerolata KACC 11604]GEO42638.1 epoxide hydrolase [Skermanella aerolata]